MSAPTIRVVVALAGVALFIVSLLGAAGSVPGLTSVVGGGGCGGPPPSPLCTGGAVLTLNPVTLSANGLNISYTISGTLTPPPSGMVLFTLASVNFAGATYPVAITSSPPTGPFTLPSGVLRATTNGNYTITAVLTAKVVPPPTSPLAPTTIVVTSPAATVTVIQGSKTNGNSCGSGSSPCPKVFASYNWTASGLKLAAVAQAHASAGTTVSTYSWNFGDGTTGAGPLVSHVYPTGGTYQVTLTVTGTGSVPSYVASSSATQNVTVAPAATTNGSTGTSSGGSASGSSFVLSPMLGAIMGIGIGLIVIAMIGFRLEAGVVAGVAVAAFTIAGFLGW